jgi:hypothetical protein
VTNTKVVQTILIYIHAKFHIFLRPPNISFYFIFSSAGKFKWKRNSKKGKASWAIFLRVGLLLQYLDPSPRASRCASHCRAAITDRCGPPIEAVFPQSPPCSAPACHRRPNSHHLDGHTSSAHATSMPTYPPAVVSHCTALSCHVASHRCCPLFCYRPSLCQPGCLRQELDDEASHSLPCWMS